ncbi:MAG TPA: serine/threonine-protein kinase [Steroidobacteraceae bacterium]|nr:serine/threonine-protein kinase [Steroidobacteraceae bacterium]
MIGEVIDHYRVLELVGRGAMGVVYKALDVNLDRQVAVKVMSVEARNDPDFVERFRQEARMQGALNHPNVALLFDYFIHDGTPVAVMEFIDGESLEQLIRRRGPVPTHEAMPIFKQALRGVAAAHRAGIIHRDLKPSNLMVTRDDIVKVMDFGIAKRQGVTGATKVSSTSIGSPLYMAPEQILGRPVDARTDIYALGITLYELLSAQRPFNTRGKAEYLVLDAHVNDAPEPPTVYRYGIPQPVVDAVMRSLAKDPDARFQSADEFMAALPDLPAPTVAAAAGANGTVSLPTKERTGTVAIPRKESTGTLVLPPRESAGTTAVPRQGPTGTVALPRVGPTGTLAIARAAPGATVAIEYSPPSEPGGTTRTEYPPTKRIDPPGSVEFDFSAGTVWQQLHPPPPSAAVSPPAATDIASAEIRVAPRPAHPLRFAAVLAAILVLGALITQGQRLRAMRPAPRPASAGPTLTQSQAATVVQSPASTEPAAPPPSIPSPQPDPLAAPPAEVAAAADQPTATLPAPTPAPARADLAGTWRGAYVDASGKQLLRVVSLSISRVHDDGGIEGTLQYEAASGEGECKLYPRGSSYSAGEQRLQLSPQSCSPHYPKELGVPLDFDRVNPRANTLKNGRIEAPTGQVIKVRLQRVSGA